MQIVCGDLFRFPALHTTEYMARPVNSLEMLAQSKKSYLPVCTKCDFMPMLTDHLTLLLVSGFQFNIFSDSQDLDDLDGLKSPVQLPSHHDDLPPTVDSRHMT